jgi:TPR repeat protein
MKKTIQTLLFLTLSLCLTSPSYASDFEMGVYELNRGEFHAAIAVFEPLVQEQYAPAQYQMGIIYQKGYGVAKNAQRAFDLFSLAAAQNYPDALFDLALMYTAGEVVDKDLDVAFTLTEKAAKKELASAQFNLGVMYYQGQGVRQDDLAASRWYQKAANQNYPLAQFNLALMYFEGKGVEKSTGMSYVWNIIATENGYGPAKKSRKMDEYKLNQEQVTKYREKANEIYRQIITQIDLKAKQVESETVAYN